MIKWINLIIGGVTGTLARYVFAGWVYQIGGSDFPYGTLVVNLTGCFLIGFLSVLADQKMVLNSETRALLMIGFCGAYTTFSTFMLETANLMKEGQFNRAFLNISISLVIGFLVFRLGMWIAEWI